MSRRQLPRGPLVPHREAAEPEQYLNLDSGSSQCHDRGYSSLSTDLRPRFVKDCRRLESRRRRTADRDGRVGRRGAAGGAMAFRTIAISRASAAWRLCNCARCSDAVIMMAPSTRRPTSRSIARCRSVGGSAPVVARFHRSSTRESAVFTDCPPGPLDREKRHINSLRGMVIPSRTTITMDMSSARIAVGLGVDSAACCRDTCATHRRIVAGAVNAANATLTSYGVTPACRTR